MARNRMIRPELWSNEQFVELSTNARLLYIAMWNFCDDGGNHPASPKTLKMETFPGDDITTADITTLIHEITEQGLITPYTAHGRPYWHITNWNNLQKIDRPNPIHPTQFDEQSPNPRRDDDENPQIKEIKEIKEKREERESAHAHEREIQNQKPVETTPHPSTTPDPGRYFEHILKEINTWARPNDWQPLRDYAASVGYDPAQYGPVADEVKKFVTYYLDPRRHPDDRAALHAYPAQFFQDKGRKWLLDAKTMNRQKPKTKDQKPKYEPPPQQRTRTNGNATPTTHIGNITGKIITEINT